MPISCGVPRIRDWALKYLHELHANETALRNDIIQTKQKAYQECLCRIDNLVKLKTSPGNGEGSLLSDEEYARQRSDLLREKAALEELLNDTGHRVEQWLKLSEQTFEFVCTVRSRFAQGDTTNKASIEKIRNETAVAMSTAKKLLEENNPQGLRSELRAAVKVLSDLQAKLDAPNRAYQAYLKELAEWQEKRNKLEGTENDAESLKGLRTILGALDGIPAKIAEFKSQQSKLALEIHAEKLAQAKVYRTLYEPVQQFIDSHALAKNKLKLEFRAELANEDFTPRLYNGSLGESRDN